MLPIIERPSPNHNPRREGPVDLLLLHYTGMASAEAALDRLCDPAAEVSSHYLIDEDGTIFRLVDEVNRAWHAGAGFWAGCRDINSRSIGIELVNPGHALGYRDFPVPQMQSLIHLAQGILARHPIPPHRVLAHSDIAPPRKQDPGELFDWALLAGHGIGLWPDPAAEGPDGDPWRGLARIGYDPDAGDAAIVAFQRHFLPAALGRGLDQTTSRRIAQIAEHHGNAR
jgi:N-acetylmuramoyl-L-alanine amidase